MYEVWFIQRSDDRTLVKAAGRNEARALFAARHGVSVSAYICARKIG